MGLSLGSLGERVDGCGCGIVCFLFRDHFRFPIHHPSDFSTFRCRYTGFSVRTIRRGYRFIGSVRLNQDDSDHNADQGDQEELAHLVTRYSKGDHGQESRLPRKSVPQVILPSPDQ